MSGSVLLHRQLSPEDLQQLLAWYKVRDTLLGQNCFEQDIKKALELASVCEHPRTVWLTKLFSRCDVNTKEEARQVFLVLEDDPRALCFAGVLGRHFDEILRVADLGDACAQAEMAMRSIGEECFRWAEKSAAQGERNGFFWLGYCIQHGYGCGKDTERAKENFLVAAELGNVDAMVCLASYVAKTICNVLFGLKECCKWVFSPLLGRNERSDV
jgi:hypothetical protein